MSKAIEKRRILLQQLNDVVAHLRDTYQNIPDPEIMVYELWTAKDILSHLTFWHESFARNVRDLACDVKPTPLRGKLSDLNQYGVDNMKPHALEVIMARLETAQKTISDHILNTKIVMIPYRRGSRDYTPEEHLEIVINHINGHLQDVVKVAYS